jgi:hypothetical protein
MVVDIGIQIEIGIGIDEKDRVFDPDTDSDYDYDYEPTTSSELPCARGHAQGRRIIFFRKSRYCAVSLGCLAREYMDGIPMKPLKDDGKKPTWRGTWSG